MDAEQLLTVGDGVVVSLEYILTVDGQVFDSSEGLPPLEYVHGSGQIIRGLESALAGLRAGESKTVQVPASQAYGAYDPDAVAELERSQFPPEFAVEVGASLHVRNQDGRVMAAHITAVDDQVVRLDLNHPLAGKDLTFQTRIADLRPATEIEQTTGRVGGGCGCSCSSGDCESGSCC